MPQEKRYNGSTVGDAEFYTFSQTMSVSYDELKANGYYQISQNCAAYNTDYMFGVFIGNFHCVQSTNIQKDKKSACGWNTESVFYELEEFNR